MFWSTQPWPWYVAGPLIGLTIPLLLLLVGKPFGISSSFRHLCSLCAPGKQPEYLKVNDWRGEIWSLVFVVGVLGGAWAAMHFLISGPAPFLPDHLESPGGAVTLFGGGLLVGFGTRYADGCTSGHAIMGLSNLSWPSLVATMSFFAGGLLTVWVLRPALS